MNDLLIQKPILSTRLKFGKQFRLMENEKIKSAFDTNEIIE